MTGIRTNGKHKLFSRLRSGQALQQLSVSSAVVILLFIGLLLYLSAPLLDLLHAPKTAVVEEYSLQSTDLLHGILIREETVIPDAGPAAVTVVNSGQAVSAGSPIAIQGDRSILAPTAGIFIAETDGFEELSEDLLSNITPREIDRLLHAAPSDSSHPGKIISGTGWLLAAAAEPAVCEQLKKGHSAILTAESDPPFSLTATVIHISPEEDGKCAVVFRCIDYLQRTAHLRQLTVSLQGSSTQGLRIPTEAVHTDEGGSFVYILSASRAEKNYVTILSEDKSDTIVSKDTSAHALHAGDTIIISAPDLKDGLLIKEGTAK